MTTRKTVFRGRLLDVGLEDALLPNGQAATLEIIRHPGAAGVLPIHEDGSVTLIHQYRHAVGRAIYEIPAGLLEPGEQPVQSAARELAEETQLQARTYQHLTTVHTAPGFADEAVHLFVARGLSAAQGSPDPDECIEVVRLTREQALSMVREGRITDAKTVCALLMGLLN